MKKLLNESEIRKFMKFANIGPLTDGFVERLTESEMTNLDEARPENMKDDDEMDEGRGAKKSKKPMREDEEGEMEEGMGMKRPVMKDDEMEEGMNDAKMKHDDSLDEMGYNMKDDDMDEGAHEGGDDDQRGEEPAEPAAAGDDGAVEAEVSVEAEDIQALRTAREVIDQILAGADGDMGGDMGDDMDPMAAEPMEEDELEEADLYLEDESIDEDFVNEVTRRVAKRLLDAKNA